MKPLKFKITLTVLLLIVCGFASQAVADISNAALLYLRIAPGARAAGMGEAYVAIADDATSTHWNPAGLGATPLADSWETTDIPAKFQPITSMTSLKARNGNDYLSFDIWAISSQGLIRYDNKRWYSYEVFNTKTDQTIKSIASSYFNLKDDDMLSRIIEKIASDNSDKEFSYVQTFTESVAAAIPEDYERSEELKQGLDSLLAAYNTCLINWARFKQAENEFNNGMKDSVLSNNEIEKLNFAVEKSKNRFIPEELRIYYSTIFEDQPEILVASGNNLLVSTENSLFAYNSKNWKRLTIEDGLPSLNISSISGVSNRLLIGTDKGIVKYDGKVISLIGKEGELPEGDVTAIGATSTVDIWTVINKKLFHFDGTNWLAGRSYTTAIDNTPASIADKFALYHTAEEKAEYIAQLKDLNNPLEQPETDTQPETDIESETEIQPETDIQSEVVVEADTTVTETVATKVIDSELAEAKSSDVKEEEVFLEITSDDQILEPGTKITIPYLAGFKGTVNSIYVGFNNYLWFGTDYGVVYFDGSSWKLPGYEAYTVLENQTFDSLMTINNQQVYNQADYRKIIKEINGLNSESVETGQVVKLYRNPSASPIKNISSRSGHVYFASENSIFEYFEGEWSRIDVSNLGSENIVKVHSFDNKLWFASGTKIATKADGRTDISMMVAKWLPQLADDMYYGFLSVVSSREGLGTFGGSITFISYGTINRRDATGADLGNFDSFDITFGAHYGTSLTRKMKVGLSTKFIYSYLTEQGTAAEQGKGTATGIALDFGFLYQMSSRLNIGLAVTNLGPDISYIDAAQSDPLPRNLAFGFGYKLINTDYYHLLITSEINKSLVGVDDGFSEELKQMVFNGGGEFMYANLFALRAGYIYDEEGDIKTITLGFGLQPLTNFKFDFAYIPSGTEAPLANTLRISLQILP